MGVGDIVKKHFETLHKDANIFWRVGLFFGIPLLFTLLLICWNKELTNDSANVLITAFSIFTGLLLNVILIIFAIVDGSLKQTSGEKSESKDAESRDVIKEIKTKETKANLLHHLYANSIYALLISVIVLLVLIITVILNDWANYSIILVASVLVYFGVMHFVMTLLMIFKRLYVLLFDCK